jgi:hypothetical protein
MYPSIAELVAASVSTSPGVLAGSPGRSSSRLLAFLAAVSRSRSSPGISSGLDQATAGILVVVIA